MKFMVTLEKILDLLSPIKVIGNKNRIVHNAVQLNQNNDLAEVIMWVSEKNISKIESIVDGVILCPNIDTGHFISPLCTYIICKNPRLAFQKVLKTFFVEKTEYLISESAKIDLSSVLGVNLYIGENVVIEKNCVIGNNVIIGHNTVLKKGTIIGNNVTIGSNSVIGGVGFGYEKDETGEFVLIPHLGYVEIKDNVEIGNNTCIDRGVLGATFLDENVKVDNLVHIAHGVQIGKNSLIIANAMVAGSVKIGNNVWVAPSSSILNGLVIENDSLIGLGAVIVKNVKENTIVIGNPGKVLDKK